jgi:flagellar basal body rod protein FlgC
LLQSSARAMSLQRSVLDVAARNVAAAQASTPEHPYARLVARFADPPIADAPPDALDLAGQLAGADDSGADDMPAVSFHAEPGSGDALTEMVAVLDAQRSYEQNATIFDTAKRLAERTIDIGRT